MLKRILIADDSRDADRIREWIENDDVRCEVCRNGAEAQNYLNHEDRNWAALILLWELQGPPGGREILVQARDLLPDVPVVVISQGLEACIAERADFLRPEAGVRDFIEKPLIDERVKSSLHALMSEQDPELPLVADLNRIILGSSRALLSTLRHIAKVARDPDARVLIMGESGTGKELIARALHDFGPHPNEPFRAINVATLSKDRLESEIFGHEKGAFTGATDLHRGHMEEARQGTLFFDEIGEMDSSLQAKLLRAIQEKKFYRLKGKEEINFAARLVCASSNDLEEEVLQHTFKPALFHRIAQLTIQVPPLRERLGDIDILLDYFLKRLAPNRPVAFARETLKILNSYPFRDGNIRQLENIVREGLIRCAGSLILPTHLPPSIMVSVLGDQLKPADVLQSQNPENDGHHELFREVQRHLPPKWLELPHSKVIEIINRVYFPFVYEQHDNDATASGLHAGMDRKTFKKRLKESGHSA